MEKKIIAIGIVLLFFIIGLCGCNEEESNGNNQGNLDKFIGTWQNVDTTYLTMNYTFFENGTARQNSSVIDWLEYWYNYEITDGKICLEFIKTKVSGCMSYSFSEDYTILTWDSIDDPGDPEVYRKIS